MSIQGLVQLSAECVLTFVFRLSFGFATWAAQYK